MAKSAKQTGEQSIPEKMREKHDAVLKLVDDFCRAHLNEEYAVLCGRLVGLLARKRPSPWSTARRRRGRAVSCGRSAG